MRTPGAPGPASGAHHAIQDPGLIVDRRTAQGCIRCRLTDRCKGCGLAANGDRSRVGLLIVQAGRCIQGDASA
jgi:hypothetical protein